VTILWRNSAEGGTNGTAVSTANSGGGSVNAFTTVTPGSGGSIVFDNSWVAHGGLAYKLTQGTAAQFLGIALGASQASHYGRLYVNAAPPASSQNILFRGTDVGVATITFRVDLNSGGHLVLRDNAGNIVGGVGTVTIAAGDRIEWFHSGTQITVRHYAGDAATPLETIGPLTVTAGSQIPTQAWQFGAAFATPTLNTAFDDLAIGDTAGSWLGPAITPLAGNSPASGSAYAALSRARPLAGTLPAADAGHAALSRARPLAGTLPAADSAHAALSRARGLVGAGQGADSAHGALGRSRGLAGSAAAEDAGYGTLSVAGTVALAGTIAAASTAYGTLSGGETPAVLGVVYSRVLTVDNTADLFGPHSPLP
jgi:hypothetical protein